MPGLTLGQILPNLFREEAVHGAIELSLSSRLAKPSNGAFLFFSLWILLLAGCSVGDFIGAYFNTYYNAQRQFSEAEDELLSQPDMKQKDLPFGYAFTIQPATKTKFAAVIEKCSKLLQYHPESNLVDDALLMIGKSYYYQNDYQPAERKCNELLQQFPNSSLAYEARLLLGYVYYMMNDKVKAGTAAKDLLTIAEKDGNDDYVAKASLLLARIEVDNQNISDAKGYYQSVAEKAGTSEERCTAYLNLAGLLGQEGNNQRALEAYRKAESAGSTYRSVYKARIGQARMLSSLGAYEESLTLLRGLLASTNYKEFFGEISLEIGNVFKTSKDYPSAIAQYSYVDTSYARTEWAANSYFQLGDLYEKRLGQFDSARICYTKGRLEFPQATVTPLLVRRSDYTGKYLQIRNEIRRLDSLKAIILAPPDTTHLQAAADSTSDSLGRRRDTTIARAPASDSLARRRDSTIARAPVSDSLARRRDSTIARAPVQPPMPLDSVNARLAYSETELATLFYTSINLPDSAEKWYRNVLIGFPLSPQTSRALFTLAQMYSLDSTHAHSESDSLYRVIADHFPDSEFAPEAERLLGRPVRVKATDPAKDSYARAEKLLDSGDTKGARDTLRVIVATYPSSPLASKAEYAIGWSYESLSDQPDSAASSYRRLLALYPASPYAPLVKPKVDEYDLNKKMLEQRAKDSLSIKKDSLSSASKDTLHEGKGLEKKLMEPSPPGLKDSLQFKGTEKDSLPGKPPMSPDTSATLPKQEKD